MKEKEEIEFGVVGEGEPSIYSGGRNMGDPMSGKLSGTLLLFFFRLELPPPI